MTVRSILPGRRGKATGPAVNTDCVEGRVETAQSQNHHVPGIDTLPSSSRRRLFVYLSYSLTWVQGSPSVRSPWLRVLASQGQLLFLAVVEG
jgi:hypothetical protein